MAEKLPGLLFTRPKKLIRSWGPEASVLGYVGIGTLSEGTCRYDLNEEDVAWLEVANREFSQMGECVFKLYSFRIIVFIQHNPVLPLETDVSTLERCVEKACAVVKCFYHYYYLSG